VGSGFCPDELKPATASYLVLPPVAFFSTTGSIFYPIWKKENRLIHDLLVSIIVTRFRSHKLPDLEKWLAAIGRRKEGHPMNATHGFNGYYERQSLVSDGGVAYAWLSDFP
jgi:hypothetical protein